MTQRAVSPYGEWIGHFRLRSYFTRRILGTLASVIVLVGALYFVLHAVSTWTFTALETREGNANILRVTEALEARAMPIASVAGDWGTWDDTYKLVTSGNPAFADENMQPSMLATLRIDLMTFVTEGGDVLQSRCIDMETSQAREFPESLEALLATRPEFVRLTNIGQESTGILSLPEGPLLFAARAVTDNSATKAPHGVIFVGRFLDAHEIAALSKQTRLDVSMFMTARPSGLPADVREVFASTASAETVVQPDDSATMSGYALLRDAYGKPVVVLRAQFPRTVYRAGQRSMQNLAAAFALFGAFTLGTIGVALVGQQTESEERRRAEETANASEERYRCLIENMAEAVLGLDTQGRVIFANPQARALTGYAEDAILGMDSADLMPTMAAASMSERTEVESGETESFESEFLNANGRTVPVELSVTSMDREVARGIASQWIAHDITIRKRNEAQLVHLAQHDYLTGLINRRTFEEELERALDRSRRGSQRGAFLWLDLDAFKDVNDRFGHKAGDDVLTAISAVLASELRSGSLLCRLGGDEFGILLDEADEEAARVASDRLLDRINGAEFNFGGQPIHVTASVGIAVFPDQASTSEELMSRADMAMYAAKQDDRNCSRLYVPAQDWESELDARFRWSTVIERALADGGFVVYAQPIVGLATMAIDRYELLIRLMGDDGVIIPPDAFLPVAEQVGLIHQIDRWMVTQAIELLAEHGKSQPLRLDVNLSGKVLSDPSMVPLISAELERTGVDPGSLGVEITETVAIFDMMKARAFIEAIRGIGCRVMLDDFGSGFSSFYYLNNLPVDGLKIDGGFVSDLPTNPKDRHIVQAIVELCNAFDITSTGEFVEDAETFGLLARYGVTYAQGYALGRPLPAAAAFEAGAFIPTTDDAQDMPADSVTARRHVDRRRR